MHLALELAVAALGNFIDSGADYLLTTTYPGLVALKAASGHRQLATAHLSSPFRLPKPIRLIREECTEKDDFIEKSLGLWDLRPLRAGRIVSTENASGAYHIH